MDSTQNYIITIDFYHIIQMENCISKLIVPGKNLWYLLEDSDVVKVIITNAAIKICFT